jgi:hypothetical protein
MRAARIITNDRTMEGDGRASVTLFWLAVAMIAALSFTLTHRELRPRDLLVGYVPADARAYAHLRSNDGATQRRGYALFDLPAGLAPDEVASFLPNGDDATWATLARWDDAETLEDAERRALEDAGAIRLSDGVFVVSPNAQLIAASLLATETSGASLDRDALGNGLRQARSVAPVQSYISALRMPFTSETPTAAVLATTFHGAGSRTVLLPLASIPNERPLLGMDFRDGRRSRPDLVARDATLILHRSEGAPAPVLAVLGDLSEAAHRYGAPADPLLKEPSTAFEALLKPPFTLSVTPEGVAALHLPHVSPQDLRERLEGFLHAAFPSKRVIVLPDGGTATEFLTSGKETLFAPIDEESVWPQQIAPGHPSWVEVAIATDGSEGSLLVGTASLLTDIEKTPLQTTCLSAYAHASESIWADDLSALFAATDLGIQGNPFERMSLNKAEFHILSERSAVLCG